MSGVGKADIAGSWVEDADHHGHEHAVAGRFADLVVERGEQLSHVGGGLAKAAEEADRLGHQHGCVHALAGNVPQPPRNATIGQGKEIVEIAGDFAGRVVEPAHREAAIAGVGQQAALDLARQIQLAANALLLDQCFGHLRVADRQRYHAGQCLQQLLVVVAEQPVARALVDHFQRPEAARLDGQRGAEDGACLEAGQGIDSGGEVGIGGGIAHHLHAVR